MSETNSRPHAPDPLDLAVEALRGATVPAGPPAELTAATLAAIRLRLPGTVPAEVIHHKRRRRIMSYIGFGSVTAAAVAVAALVWSPAPSNAAMFDQAIEKAQKAKSFRAKINYHMDKDTNLDATVMSQAGKVRIEMDLGGKIGPTVTIVDFPKKAGLSLTAKFKVAQWTDDPAEHFGFPEAVAKRLASADAPTMADALGEMKGAKFEKLPDAVVEKRTTKVFVVREFQLPGETEKSDFTLWIDPATETILKFRGEYTTGKDKGTSFEGLILDWNEKLDERQFELKVPEGYQEIGKPEKPEKE